MPSVDAHYPSHGPIFIHRSNHGLSYDLPDTVIMDRIRRSFVSAASWVIWARVSVDEQIKTASYGLIIKQCSEI